MGFKKKKLGAKQSLDLKKLIQLQKIYQKDLRKNYFVGNLFGFLAIFIIFIIGVAFFIQFPKIDFSIDGLKKLAPEMNLGGNEYKSSTKNILIIGRGGDLNDAPNLTDTIILAKVDSDNKFVTMLSIPRDLWVKYPSGGAGKINSLYQLALKKYDNNETLAIKELEGKIEEITGEKADNYINIDFRGFMSIVDAIGGIEVNVPETLVDNEFPDGNWGYKKLVINKGLQNFDGATALAYARSRHSTNDFDRSLRQQLIIQAIKEKVTSLGYLTNPFKIKALYLALKSNISTDLGTSDMISLALLAKQIDKKDIFSFNLNDSCFYGAPSCQRGGFLYTPPRESFGGASTLLPNTSTTYKVDDYSDILRFSNLIFNYPKVFDENTKINVFNSTKIGGLASIWASYITKYGFNVPENDSIGNTAGEKYDKTIILYNGIDEKDDTIAALKLFFLQTEFRKVEKAMYSKYPDTKVEVIIGKDYKTYKIY